MKRFTIAILFTMFLLAFAGMFATPARAELKAGAGKADITPDVGCYLGGYYALAERSKGVHDPLHSRALVLDDGNTRIAIITMDLVIMGGVMAAEIKDMINEKYGIPPDHVNVSATHTHTGPEGYYEEFGKYPKEYVPEMKQALEEKTVAAVGQAIGRLAPAQVGYEQFQLPDQSSNRHDPDGPVDRTAVLLVVKDAAGRPVTGFLNFAAHPTIVPAEQLLISSEYPGMFMGMMEERLGGDSVFLFVQGAAGNIGTGTHGAAIRDGEEVQLDGWGKAEDKAMRMADVVFPMLETTPASADITLAAASRSFVFKVRRKKDFYDFAAAKDGMIKDIQESDLSDTLKERRITWINEKYGIENFMSMLIPTMKRVKKSRTKTLVQAMRIGDLKLLAYPGEAITELSIRLRETLDAPVAVLGYSNDHLGYITTQKIFEEGGYEAGMGLCFPEATEEMTEALISLAGTL